MFKIKGIKLVLICLLVTLSASCFSLLFVNAYSSFTKPAEPQAAAVYDFKNGAVNSYNYTEYTISSIDGFRNFQTSVNDNGLTFSSITIKLTADLDFSSHTKRDKSGALLGTFAGIFNGQCHTISNINYNDTVNVFSYQIIHNTYYETPEYNYGGAFVSLLQGSVINLRIKNTKVTISNDAYRMKFGVIGGMLWGGSVSDCIVEGIKFYSNREYYNVHVSPIAGGVLARYGVQQGTTITYQKISTEPQITDCIVLGKINMVGYNWNIGSLENDGMQLNYACSCDEQIELSNLIATLASGVETNDTYKVRGIIFAANITKEVEGAYDKTENCYAPNSNDICNSATAKSFASAYTQHDNFLNYFWHRYKTGYAYTHDDGNSYQIWLKEFIDLKEITFKTKNCKIEPSIEVFYCPKQYWSYPSYVLENNEYKFQIYDTEFILTPNAGYKLSVLNTNETTNGYEISDHCVLISYEINFAKPLCEGEEVEDIVCSHDYAINPSYGSTIFVEFKDDILTYKIAQYTVTYTFPAGKYSVKSFGSLGNLVISNGDIKLVMLDMTTFTIQPILDIIQETTTLTFSSVKNQFDIIENTNVTMKVNNVTETEITFEDILENTILNVEETKTGTNTTKLTYTFNDKDGNLQTVIYEVNSSVTNFFNFTNACWESGTVIPIHVSTTINPIIRQYENLVFAAVNIGGEIVIPNPNTPTLVDYNSIIEHELTNSKKHTFYAYKDNAKIKVAEYSTQNINSSIFKEYKEVRLENTRTVTPEFEVEVVPVLTLTFAAVANTTRTTNESFEVNKNEKVSYVNENSKITYRFKNSSGAQQEVVYEFAGELNNYFGFANAGWVNESAITYSITITPQIGQTRILVNLKTGIKYVRSYGYPSGGALLNYVQGIDYTNTSDTRWCEVSFLPNSDSNVLKVYVRNYENLLYEFSWYTESDDIFLDKLEAKLNENGTEITLIPTFIKDANKYVKVLFMAPEIKPESLKDTFEYELVNISNGLTVASHFCFVDKPTKGDLSAQILINTKTDISLRCYINQELKSLVKYRWQDSNFECKSKKITLVDKDGDGETDLYQVQPIIEYKNIIVTFNNPETEDGDKLSSCNPSVEKLEITKVSNYTSYLPNPTLGGKTIEYDFSGNIVTYDLGEDSAYVFISAGINYTRGSLEIIVTPIVEQINFILTFNIVTLPNLTTIVPMLNGVDISGKDLEMMAETEITNIGVNTNILTYIFIDSDNVENIVTYSVSDLYVFTDYGVDSLNGTLIDVTPSVKQEYIMLTFARTKGLAEINPVGGETTLKAKYNNGYYISNGVIDWEESTLSFTVFLESGLDKTVTYTVQKNVSYTFDSDESVNKPLNVEEVTISPTLILKMYDVEFGETME